MRPDEQMSKAVQKERAAFLAQIASVDPARIKVVDESRVEVGLRLGYGYSPQGERCHDSAPYRSKYKQNLIGWLGSQGEGVVASCLSSVKGWVFRGFVKEHLVPHLNAGDVVVWDNARIHGVEGVREMIEGAGARLLPLPRYSPDLSPIEPAWAKIKHVVKRLRPQEPGSLAAAVALGVEAVCPRDATGWFAHCGYLHQSE